MSGTPASTRRESQARGWSGQDIRSRHRSHGDFLAVSMKRLSLESKLKPSRQTILQTQNAKLT